MNYEQRYKEALKAVKELQEANLSDDGIQNWVNENFHELQESEDERIRKIITLCLEECVHSDIIRDYEKDECRAWLEKKVEQKSFDYKNATIVPKDFAPKIEPKFQNGQWIVWQNKCYKVNYNGCGYELIDQNGLRTSLEYGTVDENAHLWTIQDAKDGDVLASELCDSIILFKGINDDNNIDFYCDYDFSEIDLPGDRFSVNNGQHYGNVEDSKDFHPATKEQRDTLEKAMADAGYIFDFEKKELKKIEQEPAWSKEDEYRTEKLLGWINTLINYIHEDAMVSLDLRMERIQQVEQIKTWLKSLRPQNAWKPSDEQMKALHDMNLTGNISYAGQGQVLIELYNDLKKL